MLAYLSRYTHRVAISNSRLIAFDETGVTFRYKDYRRDGADRQQVMTLAADEFIRRFLLHVLPRGFHRIRHYGLLAGSARKASLALARELLDVAAPPDDDAPDEPADFRPPCPCCGGRMIIIETFERWRQPRGPPTHAHQPGDPRMTRHGPAPNRAAAHPAPADGNACAVRSAPRSSKLCSGTVRLRRQRRTRRGTAGTPLVTARAAGARRPPATSPIRNPHSHRLGPAGSCIGDFRTPAGARNSSQNQPLHQDSAFPEVDVDD